MRPIASKIIAFGREGNFEGIQKILDEVQAKEICDMLQETMKHADALNLLSFMLKGFSESGPLTMKRLQVTEFILEELHERCLQSQHACNIVTVLITELDKYPTSHLIKIHDLCMEYMKKKSVSGSSFWKDLLPKVISILSEKDSLSYGGAEMSGSEFKGEVVERLCRFNWKGEKIASVVSLLTELSLEEKELAQVVAEIGKWLQDISAPEVPPLAHQLFRLCRKGPFTLNIFLYLRDYFSKHLYSEDKQTSKQDSESIFSEMESETYGPNSVTEMRHAEGTVLYHVGQAAILGSPLVKNLLNSFKGISYQPEVILDPFLFTVLLHLSSVSMYQKQALDILWSVIRNCIEDEEKRIESAWLRKIVPLNHQLDVVLKLVVELSASGRDRVISGLMSLGFMLLNISPPLGCSPLGQITELVNPETWVRHCSNVRERVVQRAWCLGSTLLLLLARKEVSVATPVLKAILSNIIAGETASTMTHLTGCLTKMSATMPLMMIDNQTVLIENISSLMLLAGELKDSDGDGPSVCQEVVDAIIPLVKVSSYIRDSLVVIMRKSMFSRSIASRKVAVNGFLHMLKYLKVEEFGVLSQSSQVTFSGPSSSSSQTCALVCSQVNKRGNTNESTYLELLNVLRGCLMLQPEVRKCLYEGLPSAAKHNPDLGLHFLEFLYHHLVQFLVDLEKNDGSMFTSPLDWSKIVCVAGKEACLKEPIAALLCCTQSLILNDSVNSCPNDTDLILSKTKNTLKALAVQVGKCVPSDYGLEEAYDFTTSSSETEGKKIILGQVFGVHEALISYVSGSMNRDFDEPEEYLISLMNAYSRLETFVSRIKLTDPDTKGKKKKDKEIAVPSKKGCCVGKSAIIPQSLLDSSCTLTFLKLLFMIYENCISNMLEYANFHKSCAMISLECLCEMVAMDLHYHKLASMLDEKGILSETEANDSPVRKLIFNLKSVLEMLIEKEENEEEGDRSAWHSMPYLIVSAIVNISSQLVPSANGNVDSIHPSQALLDWIHSFCKDKNPKNPKVAKLMLAHMFILGNRCSQSVFDLPFDKIIKQLSGASLYGCIEGDEETVSEFNVLCDATKSFAFTLQCQTLKILLEESDCMLKRLKCESYRLHILNKPVFGSDAGKLIESERETCTRIMHCGQIANKLAQLATPAGSLHAILIKLVVDVYSTTVQLTRYFIYRSHNRPSSAKPVFEGTRFEKLVQLVGTHLSSNMTSFRSYMEECAEESEQKKKGMKSHNSAAVRFYSKLVYTSEIFEKLIIQLSKKSKVNLSVMVKLSTSRDFRIKPEKLQEILQLRTQRYNAGADDEENCDESDEQVDEDQPAPKKTRLSM